MDPQPSASVPDLSPAQLKAQLWADPRENVHAVVMGVRMPGLPARLAGADVIDHDCLRPGALSPEQQERAPYMVQLARESAFTDWLLFEASAGFGDWGVVVASAATRLVLRAHMRSLMQARLPDGQLIDLDWMDPPIVQALLPLFDGAGLSAFMGPIHSLAIAGADTWTVAAYGLGQLQWRRARRAGAG